MGRGGVPESIEIEGKKMKVKYFRDGIILFEDNSSATYEWIEEPKSPDTPSIIEITYKVKSEK